MALTKKIAKISLTTEQVVSVVASLYLRAETLEEDGVRLSDAKDIQSGAVMLQTAVFLRNLANSIESQAAEQGVKEDDNDLLGL